MRRHHRITVIRSRRDLTGLEQLETERFDLSEAPEQPGAALQEAGELAWPRGDRYSAICRWARRNAPVRASAALASSSSGADA
jgi:hypothetical protein